MSCDVAKRESNEHKMNEESKIDFYDSKLGINMRKIGNWFDDEQDFKLNLIINLIFQQKFNVLDVKI